MENELSRIGMIVFDLRRGIEFEFGKSNLDFLKEEFSRISSALVTQWTGKIPGFPYLLEFHRAEATRLMDTVYKLDDVQFALAETSPSKDLLHELYVELILHFTDLISRIDRMTGRFDITSGRFDLN